MLAVAEEATHNEYLVMLESARDEIRLSKGNADAIRRIEDQLTLDIINAEIERLNVAITSMDNRTKAYEDAVSRIANLEERRSEQELRMEGENEKNQTRSSQANLLINRESYYSKDSTSPIPYMMLNLQK